MNNEGVFKKIYEMNSWGSKENRSGKGSEYNATRNIVQGLIDFIALNRIQRIVDVPCGQFGYMKEVIDKTEHIISYFGIDIVEQLIAENNSRFGSSMTHFMFGDITSPNFPFELNPQNGSMIVCRDLLIHLPLIDAQFVVSRLLNSGAKYVAITQQDYHGGINQDIPHGSYAPRNLRAAPFNLPAPMINIQETHVQGYPKKYLSIYELYS